MKRSHTFASAILGAALISAALSAPASATQGEVTGVEPIVRLKDGKIAMCGVGFTGTIRNEPFKAEFVLRNTRVGPIFRLSAKYAGEAPLADITLETEYASTVALMPRPGPAPDGWLRTENAIPDFTGSELMRTLMVSGGKFLIGLTGPKGDVFRIKIPGPFRQQVRASYLNCAGDLVRP